MRWRAWGERASAREYEAAEYAARDRFSNEEKMRCFPEVREDIVGECAVGDLARVGGVDVVGMAWGAEER